MASPKRRADEDALFRALKHARGGDARVPLAGNPFTVDVELSSERGDGISIEAAERSRLQAEIRRLQSEVAALEEAVRRKEGEAGLGTEAQAADMQRVMGYLLRTSGKDFQESLLSRVESEDSAEHQAEITGQLRSLATFTGIEFHDATSRVKTTELLGPVRRYSVSGQTYGVPFVVNFDVDEPLGVVREGPRRSRVMAVEPHLPAQVAAELAEFVKIVVREKALHAFFRGLVRYAELRRQRARFFSSMREVYPSHVILPAGEGGDSLVVRDATLRPGIKFTLVWGFAVSGGGVVTTAMRLLPTATSAVRRVDDSGALSNASAWFSQLVAMRGLRASVGALVDVLRGNSVG